MMKIYYVYEYTDPRNNLPFYIGKGKGNRAKQHLWNKSRSHNPYKENKIQSIRSDGYEPKIEYIAENILDENLAHELETKSILFYGRKESIEEFLFASDIFILPSFVEGISNSLLEAGSCGLPCVASDIPGNREVIENGINGFLISSTDTDGFVNAIEKLLTNKELLIKMGEENRRKIVENYSIDKIIEKYIELYNNLILKNIIKQN